MPEGEPTEGYSQQKPDKAHSSFDNKGSNTTSDILTDFPRLHNFLKRSKNLADLIGPGVVIVCAALAVIGLIDFDVGRKLSDPSILQKISAASRPALIFNSNESIRDDFGAAPLIADNGKGIHIKKGKDGWPKSITIDFTKALTHAPILTSMDETVVIVPNPEKGFSWSFEVDESIQHGWPKSHVWLFRLELSP